MAWLKRITNEHKKLIQNSSNEFNIKPIGDTMADWEAEIMGPSDTPYEGGKFKLRINIPNLYPFSPPTVIFVTHIYHPNIDTSGNICLDILKSSWSASLTLEKVMLSIQSLLNDPNPDDPLRGDVARQYKTDRRAYNEAAKNFTKRFAIESSPVQIDEDDD